MVKERARSTMGILPYKLLPKLVIVELLHFCVMWMNSFPVKSGISEKWSPREIVSRHKSLSEMIKLSSGVCLSVCKEFLPRNPT